MAEGREEEEMVLVVNLRFSVSVRDTTSLPGVGEDQVVGCQHPGMGGGTRMAGC